MDYTLLTPIRKLTRDLGINRILGNLFFNHDSAAKKEYLDSNKPDKVTIDIFGKSIQMNVENMSEFVRVKSYKNDTHILEYLESNLSDGDVFWDIGTNIGLYSLILGAKSSQVKVVCFEPEPRCFARLNANIALNDFENIECYEIALSSENAELLLNASPEFGVGDHSLMNKEIVGAKTIKIQAVKGDDFANSHPSVFPTVLKIDVEGAEIEVIKGLKEVMSNPKCRAVLCEVHFAILDKANYTNGAKIITQMLKSYGFTDVKWLDPSHIVANK